MPNLSYGALAAGRILDAKLPRTLASGTPYTSHPGFASPPRGGTSTPASTASGASSPYVSPSNPYQGQGGGGGSFTPGPRDRAGVQVNEFGRADFNAALVDWNRVYTDAQQGIPAALELIEQFAPGGGYGTGRRQEAREAIQGGVARDTASMVSTGMSSMSGARGLNTLAGRELATQYGNIEDQRAQLQVQAFSPYTQMLSNLAQVGTSRPTAGQYIQRITTPSGALTGTKFKSVN